MDADCIDSHSAYDPPISSAPASHFRKPWLFLTYSCMLMRPFRIQERIRSIKRKRSIKFLLILTQGKLPQVIRNPLKKLIPFSTAEQVAPAFLTSFSKVSTLRHVMWKSNVHKSPLIPPGSAGRRWRKTGACIYFILFYFFRFLLRSKWTILY